MNSNKISPHTVIGTKFKEQTFKFSFLESNLYAYSIGFNQDPNQSEDYKYTNQFHSSYLTFPTYVTCLGNINILAPLYEALGQNKFDPYMIMFAQQKIEMLEMIKCNTTYKHRGMISDIQDKKKFTIVTYKTQFLLEQESKQKIVAKLQYSLLVKGLTGFQYQGNNSTDKIFNKPNRNPDIIIYDKSLKNQAIIYRLNSDIDRNPLHLLKQVAQIQKFQQPILHGTASYAIVCRAIVQKLANSDAKKLKIYHARFVGHVFPGQSYKIEIWRQNKYYCFNAIVKERNQICLIGHFILHQESKL